MQLGLNIFCNIIEPWISAVYAGDSNKLSIQACMPELRKHEQSYGSLLRGLIKNKKKWQSGLISLQYGMKQFTESMHEYLKDRIQFKTQLKEIILPELKKNQQSSKKKTICVFQDGSSLAFDRVILSIPAYSAAQVLKKTPIARKLKKITHSCLPCCLCFGFQKK